MCLYLCLCLYMLGEHKSVVINLESGVVLLVFTELVEYSSAVAGATYRVPLATSFGIRHQLQYMFRGVF